MQASCRQPCLEKAGNNIPINPKLPGRQLMTCCTQAGRRRAPPLVMPSAPARQRRAPAAGASHQARLLGCTGFAALSRHRNWGNKRQAGGKGGQDGCEEAAGAGHFRVRAASDGASAPAPWQEPTQPCAFPHQTGQLRLPRRLLRVDAYKHGANAQANARQPPEGRQAEELLWQATGRVKTGRHTRVETSQSSNAR